MAALAGKEALEVKRKRHSPEEIRRSVVEGYARLAPSYDARWPFYIDATARETAARLSLPPAGRLLDVGCGTGVLLRRLGVSYPLAELCGIDPVPEMLAVARRRTPPNVHLCQGWAERLPFGDGRFDAVASCNTLHYVREPLAALKEARRVLRPGGRLVLTDWCDDYLACRLLDLYLRLFDRAHFRTYGGRECVRLLQKAGFVEVGLERYKINWWWGLMTATAARPPV